MPGWGSYQSLFPWLNRGSHDAEIRQAQAETNAIDAEYQKQVVAINRQIREALIAAESARKTVELYRDTLRPQALSTLRATVAAYQTDQTDFLNLLDSQSMAIDFQHRYFEALEIYEKSIADLEQAIGVSLPVLSRGQEAVMTATRKTVYSSGTHCGLSGRFDRLHPLESDARC